MKDNEYWITFWKLSALVLCVLISTAGGCTIHQQYVIEKLVSSGSGPIESYCAIYGVNSQNDLVCSQQVHK